MLIPSNEEGFYLEYDIGDRCDNFRPENDKMGETFSGNLLIQEVKGFSGV